MWMASAIVGALILTVIALQFPTLMIMALTGAVGSLMLVGRAHLLVPITLLAAATALPVGIPMALEFGGFSFRVYELLLVAAFLWALSRPIGPSTLRTVVVLSVWILLGMGVAWVEASAQVVKGVADVRYPAEMAIAVVVSAAAIQVPGLFATCARAMRFSLWVSTGFVALASAGLVTLAGRSETATLIGTGGELGAGGGVAATRYLTAATFFALVTVCACVALSITGRVSLTRSWTWSVPAFLLLFLAFSRNHLITIAITVVVAVLAVRTYEAVRRAFVGVLAAGVIAAALIAATPSLVGLPGASWFSSQIAAYSSRVVGGLQGETLARDSSAAYREQEIGNLELAFTKKPILGNGFGYAYQPPQGKPGTFWYDRAPYYSHNFFWWALAKTGILGLALVLFALVSPLISAVIKTERNPQIIAAAASFAGLLAVSWVAPLPIDAPTSFLIGLVLGALLGWVDPSRTTTAPGSLTKASLRGTRSATSPKHVATVHCMQAAEQTSI